MIKNAGDSYSIRTTIVNDLGLHARSAAKMATIAQQANAKIWVMRDGERVDAKSVIDILTLGCGKGSEIVLAIENQADMDVLNSIKDLINSGFGE